LLINEIKSGFGNLFGYINFVQGKLVLKKIGPH